MSARPRLLAAALGALLLGATLSGCSTLGHIIEKQSNTGAPTAVLDLRVGDCLNDADAADSHGIVISTPVVSCAADHDSEVVASLPVAEKGAYPGDDTLEAESNAQCLGPFETFVGVKAALTTLDFTYYYPSSQSWGRGDRQILCLVYSPDGPVKGSLKSKGTDYPIPAS